VTARETEIAVIGGGLVGSAIGWGLARLGHRVTVFDEGDMAQRASRANFALVWVQSKGLGMPAYATWARQASQTWPTLAALLKQQTGRDVSLERNGGFQLALSEAEMTRRIGQLEALNAQPDLTPLPYEVMDHSAVARLLPAIGPDVVGGTFCPLDGHVNSQRLFLALHVGLKQVGAIYMPNSAVTAVEPIADGFRLLTSSGEHRAAKVVLAAGTANAKLAPMVGLDARVRPQRGQIVVTERVARFLEYPVVTVRQTDEGTVMMGDSLEEVGFDDRPVAHGVTSVIADRAVRMFPRLASANVVRTWAGLRVMTEDKFPIYEQSGSCPGAFIATCHSGVSLAANHALVLAPMIAEGRLTPQLAPFSAGRFKRKQAA
jgi:glycine/D-amino acid oxidase-like deaminating enzyme